MKKLFYILLFTTLTFGAYSCGSDDNNETPLKFDDWNDKRSPNYKPEGYNPIEGEWLQSGPPNPIFKIIFTKDFKELHCTKRDNGKWDEPDTFGTYKINDKEYKRDDNKVLEWSISQKDGRDVLTIVGANKSNYYKEKRKEN